MKQRPSIKSYIYNYFLCFLFLFCGMGCVFPVSCSKMRKISGTDRPVSIYPAYEETVIPYNIAPLNFKIEAEGRFVVRFVAGLDSFEVKSEGKVKIPMQKWKKLLENHKGEQLVLKFFSNDGPRWLQHPDKQLWIAPEPIDAYLAYRLIEPGYELWAKMGIYQRCLESFEETPIMLNSLVNYNCMNCHSFHKNNPSTLLFHLRAIHAGTMFVQNGQVKKVNTKSPDEMSAGVYPRWHPDGRYVAFSVNSTQQSFHTKNENVLEVYDKNSDMILYDTEIGKVLTDSIIHRIDHFETFPEWSPDGSFLYFCSAEAKTMPQQYDSLKYDLLRVSFDPETQSFGNRLDTILSSETIGKSVAFPRISPDGKYLIVCLTAYGTFPIWHHDNDLYLLNMETSELKAIDTINSDQSDSYHSWSSNGRWIVFSSRRMDGLYTRPYMAYCDPDGTFYPPFLLPQKDPEYYDFLLKSYNIPEFITGKVTVPPRTFEKAAKEIPNIGISFAD